MDIWRSDKISIQTNEENEAEEKRGLIAYGTNDPTIFVETTMLTGGFCVYDNEA